VNDEEWRVDFECPPSEWEWAVRLFHGLGLDAEAIAPERLRSELRSISEQMLRRYRTNET